MDILKKLKGRFKVVKGGRRDRDNNKRELIEDLI